MKNRKILFICLLGLLFIGCKKEHKVVYKGFDYSDWLTREIAEEYKVEFNLEDNTFIITETELSFPKDKSLFEVEKTYYTKGNFTGNPEEDGKITIYAQEYSEDNENWTNDSYITSIEIVDGKFETEYYIVKKIENTKEHKQISKLMNNYIKALGSIWDNQLKKEKLPAAFEKAEKLATELLLCCDSEIWTEEDSFYLNRLNKTLETYQILFKE